MAAASIVATTAAATTTRTFRTATTTTATATTATVAGAGDACASVTAAFLYAVYITRLPATTTAPSNNKWCVTIENKTATTAAAAPSSAIASAADKNGQRCYCRESKYAFHFSSQATDRRRCGTIAAAFGTISCDNVSTRVQRDGLFRCKICVVASLGGNCK